MGRWRWLMGGLISWVLIPLPVEAWAQREPVTRPGVEALLETIEGRLVLALSAFSRGTEALVEPDFLRVEIFLEGETSSLSPIGTGTIPIVPGTSLRVPISIGEQGGEIPVRVAPGTSSLLIIHRRGKLVLYRQGPVRATAAPPLGAALRLDRRERRTRPAVGPETIPPEAGEAPNGHSSETSGLLPRRVESMGILLMMRLLAAETEREAGQLAVELAAPDLSGEGVFEIEWQARRIQRRVRLGAQASLRLALPSPDGSLSFEEDLGTDPHPIRYTLRGSRGEILLAGEVSLVTLMEQEEAVQGEVGPFQFDRAEYLPGEALQVRAEIRGRARAGYRMVMTGYLGDGQIFSRTETEVLSTTEPLSLTVTLPASLRPPAILEYQLLDRQTGFLYQSGQQTIPLRP